MDLRIYTTNTDIVLPKYQTEEAACFDLAFQSAGKNSVIGYTGDGNKKEYPIEPDGSFCLEPHVRYLIPTGLIFDIPEGFCIKIYARGNIGLKRNLYLTNAVGIVDSDYVDETFLLLTSHGTDQISTRIENGERLAQAEIVPIIQANLVDTFTKPEKKGNRSGGFGSTGKNIQDTVNKF